MCGVRQVFHTVHSDPCPPWHVELSFWSPALYLGSSFTNSITINHHPQSLDNTSGGRSRFCADWSLYNLRGLFWEKELSKNRVLEGDCKQGALKLELPIYKIHLCYIIYMIHSPKLTFIWRTCFSLEEKLLKSKADASSMFCVAGSWLIFWSNVPQTSLLKTRPWSRLLEFESPWVLQEDSGMTTKNPTGHGGVVSKGRLSVGLVTKTNGKGDNSNACQHRRHWQRGTERDGKY